MANNLKNALSAYSQDGDARKLLEAFAAVASGEPADDASRPPRGAEETDFQHWLEAYRASQKPKRIARLLLAGGTGIKEALELLDSHYRFLICGRLRAEHPALAAQDLADIWQDVLLAVYRKSLQGTLDFDPGVDQMIWAIAESRAQDLIRTRVRRPTDSFVLTAAAVGDAELGQRWEMLTGLQKEEVKDLIWTSIDRLPDAQKAVWEAYLQFVGNHNQPPTEDELCECLPDDAVDVIRQTSLDRTLQDGRDQAYESLINNGYDIVSAVDSDASWPDGGRAVDSIDLLVAEAYRDRRTNTVQTPPDIRRAESFLDDEDRDALEGLPPDLVTRVRSKYGALRMWSSPLWSHAKRAETYLSAATTVESRSRVARSMDELVSAYRKLVDRKRLDWAPRSQFVALLGEGGQGAVYLVKQSGFGGFSNPLALKIFAPDRYDSPRDYVVDTRRMARTAGIVAEIHHPNMLEVLSFEEQDGIRMMVMEWVDGYDLERLTANAMLERLAERTSDVELERLNEVVVKAGDDQPRLRPYIAVDIIRSCLAALERMHVQGIVHGDLKPSNIMLTRNGYVKLIDIGSAFVWKESPVPHHCTYRYAAPEVLQEGGRYTPQSDLASLGYVLVELLSGRALFAGLGNGAELLQAKLALPDQLADLLPEKLSQDLMLRQLCHRLVDPDPKRRFSTARDADLHMECGTLALRNQMIRGDLSTSPEHEISNWLKTLG